MLTSLSSQICPAPAFQHLLPLELPRTQLPPRPSSLHVPPAQANPSSPHDFGFGILSAFCNPAVVDRVLAECNCREQRCRLLPSRLMVYSMLLMCLNPDLSYEKLMHHVAEVAPSSASWPVPNRSSFARARVRLGWQAMERLFRDQARPLAETQAACCFWRERRVITVDGTTMELADSPELWNAFGGQIDQKGKHHGAPMLRAVSLTESGTRGMVDVELAHYDTAEIDLAAHLVRSIRPGMLILADRNFSSVKLWKRFIDAGADLLWRARSSVANRIMRHLPDGTYLSSISSAKGETVTVRVIEYTVANCDEVYRLLTNLLDPAMAPAHELARLYTERWEVETSYKELKAHQSRGLPFRSHTEAGVRQEFWTHCLLYNITRQLAYKAAMTLEERDPDRISFTLAKDAVCRSARRGTGLKVSRLRAAVQQAVAELTQDRAVVNRRNRSCPRIVRQKRHKYPSRAGHNGPASTYRPRSPAICPLAANAP